MELGTLKKHLLSGNKKEEAVYNAFRSEQIGSNTEKSFFDFDGVAEI
ncbi:hypothetical protein [Macrococcus capreoli]